MKADAERILIAVGLIFLAFASIETFATGERTLTEEEAVQISMNTPLVRQWLENSDRHSMNVLHLNRSEIDKLLEEWPGIRERFPENHGVWEVGWSIHPAGAPSAAAIDIDQIIDEETGEVTSEGSVGLR